MDKRTILLGSMLLPCMLMAQTHKDTKADSVAQQDMSLVGIIDLSDINDEVQDDEGTGSQEINTTVITSHDVFLNKAGYNLSQGRFRVRGYKNIYEDTYINGVPFNDQLRGVFNYSSIGAINILTRNGDRSNYSMPSAFSFGTIGGGKNILMRAGDFAHGGQVALSGANRNYRFRAMGQMSTGMTDKGWAVTGLLGGRYSYEGNVEGTYYRNMSYAFLVEKEFNGGKHRINFTTFGSPVNRAQQNGSVQEVYDLRDNNLYNSNWGYQNGKKRNSRIVKAFDPTSILGYEGKLSDNVTLNVGAAFHMGLYSKSALNWFNAADPRPDYYRYLPSYMRANYEQALAEGNIKSEIVKEGMLQGIKDCEELWRSGNAAYTQVNWDKMINANRQNVRSGDGSALYMVEERHSNLYETTLNATLQAKLNKYNKVTVGLVGRNTISHQYKTVGDLLGAQYVLDIDKYAARDFPGDLNQEQKDLRHPNRRVTEGGIFDYDFKLHVNSIRGWVNNQFDKGHWAGYYGAQLTYTDFFRDGKMQNGHNPDNSYGVGVRHNFTDIMLKAGLTYKFNGSHLLQGNVMYGTVAPLANDAYISSRYSDKTPENLKSSRIFHIDASYIFSTPKLQGRISAFNTSFFDLTERSTYYYDGVTLVNQVLSGVHKVHRGIEAAVSYKVGERLTLDAAGTVAQYYYANNPIGSFSTDNGKDLDQYKVAEKETVYMRHVKESGVPSCAGTFGARYFIKYWFLGANINVFGGNYVQASPARRVASRYAGNSKTDVPPVTPYNQYYAAYRKFTHQERFATAYTIDLSVSKLIFLSRRESLNINLSVNNILNRRNIKTGGYEQARIDLKRPTLFANRYFYMQGINFFLNVSYKF